MKRTNQGIIQAFHEGREKHTQVGNLIIDGDVLYSYGSHFPLAVRKAGLYLINGDGYSATTSAHRSKALSTLTPNVQISMGALGNLGSSETVAKELEMVDHTKDRYETVEYKDKDGELKTREVHFLGEVLFRYDGRSYVSGFDRNEVRTSHERESYFVSELPTNPQTVERALLDLAPRELRRIDFTLKAGVERQGEFFFYPIPCNTRECQPLPTHSTPYTITVDDIIVSRNYRDIDKPFGYALKANHDSNDHVVSEARTYQSHLVARGYVRHPQHSMLKLGKGWHRVYKNTAVRSFGGSGVID